MRFATLAALTLGVGACTTHTTLPDPSGYIDSKHPKAVWVTVGDSIKQLDHPRTNDNDDTIVGYTAGRPVSIALADIRRVAAAQTDWLTTLLGAGALTVAAFLLFYPRN